jgi:hypothetical protein
VLRDLPLYAPTAMHWEAAGHDTAPNAAPSVWDCRRFREAGPRPRKCGDCEDQPAAVAGEVESLFALFGMRGNVP